MSQGEIDDVLSYWFGAPTTSEEEYLAKVRRWFMGGAAMDADIAARFGSLFERAARGELDAWADTPRGRLALIILLDQFSRNLRRGRADMYALDEKAQRLALDGIDAGADSAMSVDEKIFFNLPLSHSEDLALHERSVAYVTQAVAGAPPFCALNIRHASNHRDTIAVFGRFPHRNAMLGRESTAEELAWIEQHR